MCFCSQQRVCDEFLWHLQPRKRRGPKRVEKINSSRLEKRKRKRTARRATAELVAESVHTQAYATFTTIRTVARIVTETLPCRSIFIPSRARERGRIFSSWFAREGSFGDSFENLSFRSHQPTCSDGKAKRRDSLHRQDSRELVKQCRC